MRDKDKRTLGIVGGHYRPLQNREAFGFLDELISKKEAMITTAGSLDGGRCIWLLARLPGDIVIKRKGYRDELQKLLLLTNRHDGLGSVSIKLTATRVCCANTLAQALRGGALHVRHTASVVDRVNKAYETIGLASRFYTDLGARVRMMAGKSIKDEDVRAYFERCLLQPTAKPASGTSDVDEEDSRHRSGRAVEKAMELYETGRGAEMARGTLWGGLNAITELVDHYLAYRSEDARLRNIWIEGTGHALKARTYDEASRLLRV